MKKILPALVVLVAVLGGGAGAMMTMGSKSEGSHGEPKTTSVHHPGTPKAAGYFKFKRPFVVPVVAGGEIASLVMIDLSVEMDSSIAEGAIVREPKVRDGMMRTLLSLSNEGYFTGDISNIETYDAVRERLTAEAKQSLGETVESVLILDYARQER